MKFIGRQRELQALENFVQTPGAGLLILYGRRRVGKTSLLTQFSESHKINSGFYWMATTHNANFQLRDFSQALFRYDPRFIAKSPAGFSYTNWEEALNHLAEAVAQFSTLQFVVIDEFTYILRNDPAFPSLLQRMWDHVFSRQANLKLVLTGSLVGMMEREVISYHAPLYGRATALIHLRPLPYGALLDLFPERTPAERVAIYAVTGGVPAYLNLFTQAPTFVQALQDKCLATGSIMLGDPAVMLHEQLREPQTFESVLSAIGNGFHRWREIATMAGVTETGLSHYLRILEELELIERRDPILSSESGRRGKYYIRDQFLHFYYRFIVPHLSKIDRGLLDVAVTQINEDLRAFIGAYTFEDLCREWALTAGALGRLNFEPEMVGSYWRQHRSQGVQLDVVAANRREKKLLIGECKWGKAPVSHNILTDLLERSRRMPQVIDGWQVQYVLFGREGFTQATHSSAQALGIRLVDLVELEDTLAAVYSG